MAGIIMVKASSAEVEGIIYALAQLLDFLMTLPFPRAFLEDTKFVVARDRVTMRGRDATTREIKTLHVRAGTPRQEIREFFSY
jgi:hypothetical protein